MANDLMLRGIGSAGSVGGQWTPAQLGGLALWLDADDATTITLNGSNVSQWNDKSGNSRNLSQATAGSQPEYLSVGFSGKPSIRNTGGAKNLEAVSTSLGRNVGGMTAVIVGMHPVGAVFAANATDFFISTGALSSTTRLLLSPNLTTAITNRYAVGGRRLDGDAFGTVASTTDSQAGRGIPWIRIGNRDYSGGVVNHFTNGTQDLTNFALQGAGNTSDTNALRTAIFVGAADAPSNTELSEIVVTHSTLSTTDRQKLEGYLAWKWGLEANLPGTHPYRYTPPTTDEPAWDADALDYIGRVQDADGQGLERNVRVAIDDFVKGCKADGIWTAIKSSAILAGARTLSGALVPLVGAAPTNFNFVAGNYNRKTGLVGDGSTKYISSGRANNADPQNSKHLSIYVSSIGNAATQYLIAAGTYGTAGNSSVFRDTGTYRGRVNVAASSPASVINSGVLPSPAFVGVSRTAANSQSIRASTITVSNSLGSVTPSSEVVNIYAGPSTDRIFSNSRLAFYSIGEALNLALLDARVTTLINAYGAAIP